MQNGMRPYTISNMPRLVQAPNLVMAMVRVGWLRAEGFGATVQREFLRSASGELPPDQCLPAVWIDDGDYEAQALELLRILRHAPQRRWVCHLRRTGGRWVSTVLELHRDDVTLNWECAALS